MNEMSLELRTALIDLLHPIAPHTEEEQIEIFEDLRRAGCSDATIRILELNRVARNAQFNTGMDVVRAVFGDGTAAEIMQEATERQRWLELHD